MKRLLLAPLSAAFALIAIPATADVTVFAGINATPSARPAKGFAGGVGLLIVGFEFEYSSTARDREEEAPELRSGMGNVYVQTPIPVARTQYYATLGAGVYRERFAGEQETNFGMNVGGGVKIVLAGPLRLRLDYRIFTLRGEPLHKRPQRVYAGLNLAF
jgi:hypothetical protein